VLGTGQTGAPEPAPAPADPAPEGPVVEVALDSHRISDPNDEGMPQTEVVILWGPVGGEKTRVAVDTTYGGCSVPPWMEDVELDDDELGFLHCWHAGEGMDYSLSRHGDDLTVDRSYTSEDPDAYDESDGEVHRLSFEPGTEFRPAPTP
jgi:hypothetical protein